MEACSLSDDWPLPSSAFSDALPRKVPQIRGSLPTTFETYLSPKILKPRRSEGATCREAWAFVISGMIQYGTWLAYDRLGLFFNNSHMSVEYLLSCYEKGSHAMCGCLSADLPAALLAVSELGEVTFRQFSYVASITVSEDIFSRQEDVFYCQDKSYLGTCARCSDTADNYTVTTLAASPDRGAFRYVVPCFPCLKVLGPLYHPAKPFHISSPSSDPLTLEDLISCIKSELLRFGPLPASLGLDMESFDALQRGGNNLLVTLTEDGIFYKPRHMMRDRFHAVLIVGYASSPRGSYWICRTSHRKGAFGYTLKVDDGEKSVIEGLFNVDMKEDRNVLIDRVMSCEKMMIAPQKGRELQELSENDPVVMKVMKIAPSVALSGSVASDAVLEAPRPPRSHASRGYWPWLWLLFVFGLLTIAFAFL